MTSPTAGLSLGWTRDEPSGFGSGRGAVGMSVGAKGNSTAKREADREERRSIEFLQKLVVLRFVPARVPINKKPAGETIEPGIGEPVERFGRVILLRAEADVVGERNL